MATEIKNTPEIKTENNESNVQSSGDATAVNKVEATPTENVAKEKKVIATKVTGYVKWFNVKNGYWTGVREIFSVFDNFSFSKNEVVFLLLCFKSRKSFTNPSFLMVSSIEMIRKKTCSCIKPRSLKITKTNI